MSQEKVEVVRRAIAAYNRRDFEAMGALNHPDVEVDWSASRGLQAGVYQGWEAVMRFYQNFLETFQEVAIEPDRLIESGDSVVVPNSARVRGRDGIETVARSALVFEVRGGRLARICLYQETHQALEAVGLSEEAMSNQNVELVQRGIDALNRGGVDAVVDLCDPEVEWIAIPGFLPDAEDYHGHAGVRAWFEKVGEVFAEAHWEAEEITAGAKRLLVTLRLQAAARASGIEGEFQIFQAWTIRAGKLVRLESYLSRDEALEAAGLKE